MLLSDFLMCVMLAGAVLASPVSKTTTYLGSSPAITKTLNLFQAIATTAPYSAIPTVTHPFQPSGFNSSVLGQKSIPTNNFYCNMFLEDQTQPAYMYPYVAFWNRGSSGFYGLGVSLTSSSQRVYGPDASANPVEYYYSPTSQMLSLSAVEFDSDMTMSLSDPEVMSVTLALTADTSTYGSGHYISVPLVQGAGFVTGVYNSLTPRFDSTTGIASLSAATSPRSGMKKYKVVLSDGTTWAIYATVPSGQSFDLTLTSSWTIEAAQACTGVVVQIAKIVSGSSTAHDNHAGMYPVGVTLHGTAYGKAGEYDIKYAPSGSNNAGKLMQYALSHHVSSMRSDIKRLSLGFSVDSPAKGKMYAYSTNDLIMEEGLWLSLSFKPWSRIAGSTANYTTNALALIRAAATSELQQDMASQINDGSMYYSGKAFGKFAMICYVAHMILKDDDMASDCLTRLKAVFATFKSNQQTNPLNYDITYRGIISSAGVATADYTADFGGTYYSDHHFHYGYHIHAAAVIGLIDADMGGNWISQNKAYVNSLVRDVANPSTLDTYFPVSRSFSWFHGHSFAKGILASTDGKDQESSSEDYHHAYGIKLWGQVTLDYNMMARGSMMLAIMDRAMNDYILMTSSNTIQPSNFIANKVAGIIFENKCDHTTYFGTNIEYIQGIHMMPLTPVSSLIRHPNFVEEEWDSLLASVAPTPLGAWTGVVYGNLGLYDPQSAYDFFAVSDFDTDYLDSGASLTWYLAYLAGVGGATS
ncbi:endo-1,3(4)-beta-glucanase [Limtongia smithiae]|uniref:endo-1,3(4)-beta-glucanase n=1 Tax=Limtongia smithiae TaxID=1125753 RepID=UPI0034CDAA1C